MARRRGKSNKPKKQRKGRPKIEWVGGIATSPLTVAEDGGPEFAPMLALWIQRPPGTIVGTQLAHPDESSGLVASALQTALAQSRDKPSLVRVATQQLATEVRAVLAPGTPIIVAPTPELDAAVADLARATGTGRPTSYFSEPLVTAPLLERFFAASEIFWHAAPWKIAHDGQVIRVDVPELGITGACASILGAAGQQHGIALFQSPDHYDAFVAAARQRSPHRGPIDLGGDELLLSFDQKGDLPKQMVREAESHRWPVVSKRAFPTLLRVLQDGAIQGASARELRLMTALAPAIVRFTLAHRRLFEDERGMPASDTFEANDGPELTLTAPHDAYDLFEEPEPEPAPKLRAVPPPGAKVGRNDPCPCGSGKKYKKCCLNAPPRAEAHEAPPRAEAHDVEQEIFADMLQFGVERFGPEIFDARAELLLEADAQLGMPWLAYVLEVEGATIAEHYARTHTLSPRQRDHIDAQLRSWLSVWEIIDVDPGRSLTLKDLLSGEHRVVHEVSGSRGVSKRLALLGRVVDFEGRSFLGGSHPRPLPPGPAAKVVEQARKRLRRKRAVPVERLRGEAFARYLLTRWDDAVYELEEQAAVVPKLVNTEGHDLLLTIDHFSYEPRAHDWLLERLARLEHIDIERQSTTLAEATFYMPGNPQLESWDNTVIGHATADHGKLTIETNSRERADALCARIIDACDDIVRKRGRTFSDPTAAPNREPRPSAQQHAPPPPEALAMVAELKARHYATWPDTPIPALNGDTPRQHIQTAAGRRAVELLIKEAEYFEQRDPATAFDFTQLRQQLGLKQ